MLVKSFYSRLNSCQIN